MDGQTHMYAHAGGHIPFLAVLALTPVLLRGEFRSDQKLRPTGVNGYIHLTRHTAFSVSCPTALVTQKGTDLSGYMEFNLSAAEITVSAKCIIS